MEKANARTERPPKLILALPDRAVERERRSPRRSLPGMEGSADW